MGVEFEAAVQTFIDAAPWLAAEDEPALVGLRAIADELDHGNHTPAMFAQWGLGYRALIARKPVADTAPDEFERLLAGGDDQPGDGSAA